MNYWDGIVSIFFVGGESKEPTIDTMIMIADVLDVSLDELVGRNAKIKG